MYLEADFTDELGPLKLLLLVTHSLDEIIHLVELFPAVLHGGFSLLSVVSL